MTTGVESWLSAAGEAMSTLGEYFAVEVQDLGVGESPERFVGGFVPMESGDSCYYVGLGTDPSDSSVLLSKLLGLDLQSEEPELIGDALGELANVFAGIVKDGRLDGDISMGLPIATRGVLIGKSAEDSVFRNFAVDGIPVVVSVSVRQISWEAVQSRKLQSEVARATTRLHAIMDSVADGIITTNERNEVETLNPAAERLLGVVAAEAESRPLSDFLPSISDRDTLTAQTGDGVHEHEVVRGDGSSLPVDVTFAEFSIDGGTCLSVVARDARPRKESEAELRKAHSAMSAMARRAGMAEVASDVLHNVGNALNSVEVATSLISRSLSESRLRNVASCVQMLQEHETDLVDFLSNDEKGRAVLPYVERALRDEIARLGAVTEETESVRKGVSHISSIVARQQQQARGGSYVEELHLSEVVADAVRLCRGRLRGECVQVVDGRAGDPALDLDHHVLTQIVTNLVANALDAVAGCSEPSVLVRLGDTEDGVEVSVTDNGCGMSEETAARLFQHGFTTKQYGNGFGLHGSALFAAELDGRLTGESAGVGRGSTFRLSLPIVATTRST